MIEKGRVPLVGTLESSTADSIVLTADRGSTFRLARESVRRFEVSVGHRRPVKRYAQFGGIAGLIAGAALGAVTYEPCERPPGLNFECLGAPTSRAVAAGFGAAVGGAAGVVAGAIVGATQVVEAWRPAMLDVRPAILPSGDSAMRVALVVRVRANFE